MKTKNCISMKPKFWEKTQELGLNVSKVCENALKQIIKAIESVNSGMGARLIIREDGNHAVSMPPLKGGRIGNLEVTGSNPVPGISVDWNAFERWLKRDKKKTTVNYTLTYAKEFQDCLWNSDLSRIADLPVSKRRLVMASLSNLAKFLGLYDQWKRRFISLALNG